MFTDKKLAYSEMIKQSDRTFLLFRTCIKPAILISESEIKKRGLDVSKYYQGNFRKDIILSHTELPVIADNDHVKLGIALGYYPKSCELFLQDMGMGYNEFIDFGGIYFNTMHLYDEAFEWCIENYKEKMLIAFGKIEVEKSYSIKDKEMIHEYMIKYEKQKSMTILDKDKYTMLKHRFKKVIIER